MEFIVSNLITALIVIFAYSLGIRNGQKIANNEKVNVLPDIKETVSKVEDISEHFKQKEELEELDSILQNLDNYDGTANGQKTI